MRSRATAVLMLLATLAACASFPFLGSREIEEDLSVRIPPFPPDATTLDGPTLQAMRVAADDFASRPGPRVACEDSQFAYVFRAFRQGDIIFVRISHSPNAQCPHSVLDGGAVYAIRLDGRILRRLPDGYPDPAEPPPGAWRGERLLEDGGLALPPGDGGRTWIPPWERLHDAGPAGDAGRDGGGGAERSL